MNIYLAASPSKQFFDLFKKAKARNILMSYAFSKSFAEYQRISDNWFPENYIIDSGAFSIWTGGGSIDKDKYANYCKEMRKGFPDTTKMYFTNLDVLPGKFGQRPTSEEREASAEASWKNMEYFENKGMKVINVFHQHEDFKWLDRLHKEQEYFGISPANDVSMKEKLAWLNKVFSKIKASRKTHGFAVTSFTQLSKYPFYSADSSSWSAGGRFARVTSFKQGKMKTYNFKDEKTLSKMIARSETKSIDILNDYNMRNYENILSYIEMEKFLTELWKNRGVIWDK